MKKPDLCALGGILMAWQVGLMNFKTEMKKKKSRIQMMEMFIEDKTFNVNMRKIVRHSLMNPRTPIEIDKIQNYFKRFIGETSPGKRVFERVEK